MFFTKSSMSFALLNVIRLLSVTAICLALAGQFVVMVSDIKGYRAADSTPSALTSTSRSVSSTLASATSTRTADTRLIRRHADVLVPTLAPRLPKDKMARLVRREPESLYTFKVASISTSSSSSKARATKTASADESVATALSPADEARLDSCSYVGQTSVPKQIGGILFSSLDRIFCIFILLFALLTEAPPPLAFIARFWAYAFPPFGASFGLGVLGVVQVFVGCVSLSHSVDGFPMVAFWLLFIVGFLNMLVGLAFGARARHIRAVLTNSADGVNFDLMGRAACGKYENFDKEPTPKTTTARNEKRQAIQISAPMPAPPVYVGGLRENE